METFHRSHLLPLLLVRVHTVKYYEYGKEIESEHEKVVRVPCFTPILAVPCEMQGIRAHTEICRRRR